MARVLHLHETGDFAAEYAIDALARHAGPGLVMTRRTLGRGGDDSNLLSLARAIRSEAARARTVVHAWSTRPLLAALSTGRRVVYSPRRFPSPRTLTGLKIILPRRDLTIVAATECERQRYILAQLPSDRVRVIPPPADAPAAKIDRQELRRRLGLAEEDFVVLPCGATSRDSGARIAIWALSILHVLDPRFRVLLWGSDRQAEALSRFATNMRQPRLHAVTEQRPGSAIGFDQLVQAADVALSLDEAPQPLPLLLCMAAGVPLLTARSAVCEEILGDAGKDVFTSTPSPRVVAQTLLELRQDPARLAHLRQSQHRRSIEFSAENQIEKWLALYRG